MFITNRDIVNHQILYRIAGVAARQNIAASSSVNISEITDISEIVFKTWERKARDINNRINGHPSIESSNAARFIDTKIDYRLIFSGITV